MCVCVCVCMYVCMYVCIEANLFAVVVCLHFWIASLWWEQRVKFPLGDHRHKDIFSGCVGCLKN